MNLLKTLLYRTVYLCGFIVHILSKMRSYYENQMISQKLGGGARTIQYPYRISGVENIECGDNVNIGKGSVIMCLRSKLIIKGHFVSGPNMTIIAGDHMSVVGMYLDTVSDLVKDEFDNEHIYDKDVIIEEDVWAGANVTILKGVTIGRGCIIAAGSVVTKSMPPYCILGGIPAKPIRMRWTIEQIIKHEEKLYDTEERLSIDDLRKYKQQLEIKR